MFALVLIAVTVLAGLAFDWISFNMSPGRIVISINIAKFTPMIRKLRDAAFGRSPRRDSLSQHNSHH